MDIIIGLPIDSVHSDRHSDVLCKLNYHYY